MIDVTNLDEIYAHLEAHPAMSLYQTCPCGVEIHSYTGWIQHAVLPLLADGIHTGFDAGVRSQAPHNNPIIDMEEIEP